MVIGIAPISTLQKLKGIGTMKNYLWKYFLPGFALIGCAFWVGTLPSMIFSLLGFLSFFLAGVALIIEGWKQKKRGTL
jgi:hypothetical protein